MFVVGENALGKKCEQQFGRKFKVDCCQVEKFDFSIQSALNCFQKLFTPSTISPQAGYTYKHVWNVYSGAFQVWSSGTINGIPTAMSYTFTQNGNYQVRLIVIKINNLTQVSCMEDYARKIKIDCHSEPCQVDAKFTYTNPVNCRFNFTDLSTVGTGTNIISWHWNFGDGTSSTAQNPVKWYSQGGTYMVTLTVNATSISSQTSCTDTYKLKVKVNGPCLVIGDPIDLLIEKDKGKVQASPKKSFAKVSPNPTFDKVFVELDKVCEDCVLTVYNPEGKQLLTQKMNSKFAEVNLSQFQAGTYRLVVEGVSTLEHFIVIKK